MVSGVLLSYARSCSKVCQVGYEGLFVTWVTVAWVTVDGRIVENPPNSVGGVFVGRGPLSLLLLT